ncbi:single-stranded DNA-binding protein [Cellulomonas hominis]
MSIHEPTVTLVGWLGSDPKFYGGSDGQTPFATFRIASTRRVFDREQGTWNDGRTTWFTVKTWRDIARNVSESLRKGDPVLAHGRLSTDEWVGPDGVQRSTVVLEAVAVGPDLSHGTTRFARTVHTAAVSAGQGERPDPSDGSATTPDGELPEDGGMAQAELAQDMGGPADLAATGADGVDDHDLAMSGAR